MHGDRTQRRRADSDFINELFYKGNYTGVIDAGCKDHWQTYAALGVIGKTGSALEGLGRFDNEEARFYSAVAMWMEGNEDGAAGILEKQDSVHAANLLALIRKPKINILGQLDMGGWWDLASALDTGGKFRINNIGFGAGDIRNSPYVNIHQFYNRSDPPDFYISKMLEWHHVIPNLRELPCPVFGHTADYDVHIQAVYPWLSAFDELIVEKDWNDIHDLAKVPVATFPKAYSLPSPLPSLSSSTREIDVFLSGTINHSYHPDKAMISHAVLGIEEVNSLGVSGFLSVEEYLKLLGNSKIVVAFAKRPGIATRGLEAIAMGVVTIVEDSSAIRLFLGEEEGLVAVSGQHELEQTIRKIVRDWPAYEQRAQRGAEIARNEFERSRVALQYFRFLTFMASKPRGKRDAVEFGRTVQKRSIFVKGWSCHPRLYQEIRERNFELCAGLFKQESVAKHLIDMARECVLEYATWQIPEAAAYYSRFPNAAPALGREMLDAAVKIYDLGLKWLPLSLVLRFNYIRAMLHFGQPDEVDKALALALDTLSQPLEVWQVDPMDDVFPYDFFGELFNYRTYFDSVVSLLQGRMANGTERLARLILASINYYVSRYTQAGGFALDAVRHDPEFPFYKLNAAKHLIEQNNTDDIGQARQLLLQLTDNTMLCLQASRLLESLKQDDRKTSVAIARMNRISGKIKKSGQCNVEGENIPLLKPAHKGVDTPVTCGS